MTTKYLDTQPTMVDAVRFDGRNTDEVRALTGRPVDDLAVGSWVVRDGDRTTVLAPDEFEARYTPVDHHTSRPPDEAIAVVADTLAFEGGMD